jgi:hypothetical protein
MKWRKSSKTKKNWESINFKFYSKNGIRAHANGFSSRLEKHDLQEKEKTEKKNTYLKLRLEAQTRLESPGVDIGGGMCSFLIT